MSGRTCEDISGDKAGRILPDTALEISADTVENNARVSSSGFFPDKGEDQVGTQSGDISGRIGPKICPKLFGELSIDTPEEMGEGPVTPARPRSYPTPHGTKPRNPSAPRRLQTAHPNPQARARFARYAWPVSSGCGRLMPCFARSR